MMSSGLGEPLQGGDESGSQSGSHHSSSQERSASGAGGSSLLERIQLQRQREAAALQHQTPQHIQVPNYGASMPGMGNHGSSASSSEAGNFFSSAWNNIAHSMETGMAERNEMESALLAPASRFPEEEENYSMQNYFMTFVKDVYGLFLRLPVPARFVAVIGLLYIALKLL